MSSVTSKFGLRDRIPVVALVVIVVSGISRSAGPGL